MDKDVYAVELSDGILVMGEISNINTVRPIGRNLVVLHFIPAQKADGSPKVDSAGSPVTRIAMSSYPPLIEFGARVPLNKDRFKIGPYVPEERYIEAYKKTIAELRSRNSGIDIVSAIPPNLKSMKPN